MVNGLYNTPEFLRSTITNQNVQIAMDSALDQIAEKCGSQLRAYQKIVFHQTDKIGGGNVKRKDRRYLIVRKKSSRLSKYVIDVASVSVLRNIKRACLPSIEKYDSCLSKNKSNPLSCIDILRDLTTCVDAAAKREGIVIPQPQGL